MNQSKELHFTPDFQSKQMVVTGDIEVINDVAAVIGREIEQCNKVLPKAGKLAIQAENTPQVLVGRTATVAAKLFDLRFGTHMFDALQEKRSTERDLRFAGKIGLFQEEVCAKHRKALNSVKAIN